MLAEDLTSDLPVFLDYVCFTKDPSYRYYFVLQRLRKHKMIGT